MKVMSGTGEAMHGVQISQKVFSGQTDPNGNLLLPGEEEVYIRSPQNSLRLKTKEPNKITVYLET